MTATDKARSATASDGKVFPILVLLSAALFLLDLRIPRGATIAIAYIPLVFVAALALPSRQVFLLALLGTLFTALDPLLSSDSEVPWWMTVSNRALTIVVIWCCGAWSFASFRRWLMATIAEQDGPTYTELATADEPDASNGALPGARSHVASVLGWLFVRERVFRIYQATARQESGTVDPAIEVHDADTPARRAAFAQVRAVCGGIRGAILERRIRQFGGLLLTYREGERIVGFGWVQPWEPLRGDFSWLGDDGVALGPYWVDSAARGRGVHEELLRRSLAECRQRGWTLPFVLCEAASPAVRDVERTGFAFLGTFRIRTLLLGLIRRVKRIESPVTGQVRTA